MSAAGPSAEPEIGCKPVVCDVVVVGAELAGLVAGAILARRGKSVVVVDMPPQIGGGGGGTPFHGYWLDGGHRDGHDVTDLEIGWGHGARAAREAGVEVPIAPIASALRVMMFDEFPPKSAPPGVPGEFTATGFARLAQQVFGLAESDLADFGELMARLSGAKPEEWQAEIETPLADWLAANVPRPEIRNAALVMAKTIFCEYPERASAGRLMSFFGDRGSDEPLENGFSDDPAAGGMQGLSVPFAKAIEDCGGRLLLGRKPLEVLFDGPRATGLVAITPSQLVLEVEAEHVILSYPVWDALPLLPPERVSAELSRMSERLEDESGDGLALQIGLSRLPRLRATGEVDDHAGWNRWFVGDERRYRGGYHIPSMTSRSAAPAGRHLLNAMAVRWLRRDEHPRWAETKEVLEAMRATLRQLYVDFDECVDWEAYQWVQRPAAMAWFWGPVERHPVSVPGCERLYFANTTIESASGPVDICAHAGLLAAEAVLASES